MDNAIIKSYQSSDYYVKLKTRSYGYCVEDNSFGYFQPRQERFDSYKDALDCFELAVWRIQTRYN